MPFHLCKSVGVIYCNFCTKCNRNIYVGQTGDTLYQGMLLNFSKIRTGKIDDPVANHFCQIDHSVDNFKVLGIDQAQGDKIHREVKDSLWIKKLKTYEPLGLNTKMTYINFFPGIKRHERHCYNMRQATCLKDEVLKFQ